MSAIPPLRNFSLKILGWLWLAVIWAWRGLTSSYLIPGWVLLVTIVFALIGILNIIRAFRPESPSELESYTEDFLYGAKWRWSWIHNNIFGLWCFCPHCDAQLVYDDSSCRRFHDTSRTDFICEHCGNQVITSIPGGNKEYAVGAALREIQRRIRTNQYKKL